MNTKVKTISNKTLKIKIKKNKTSSSSTEVATMELFSFTGGVDILKSSLVNLQYFQEAYFDFYLLKMYQIFFV